MIEVKQTGDLIHEGTYRIHSSFEYIENFININQNIISIAEKEKYLNPNSIIVKKFKQKSVKTIEVKKRTIIINDQTFKKKELKLYNSTLRKIHFDNSVLQRFKTSIDENIDLFNPMSLSFLINPGNLDVFKSKFQQAYKKHFRNALKKIEKGKTNEGFSRIKGAGIGLTPSGDDFTSGYLHALSMIEQAENEEIADKKIIYEISIGKNPISNEMLYHAYRGASFKYLKDFQESIIKDANDQSKKINLILSIGETSGSDILTGLYFGLKHYNKNTDDKRDNKKRTVL